MESSSLHQSFLALREYFVDPNHHSNIASPAQLVVFAERAFKEGCASVASECLELYFSLNPPTNQFLIRAHLCQALIVAATCSSAVEPEESLQKAVDCIITAVDIAKKSECYHFLVHNASVLLWQICRPYRKQGWMSLCTSGWQCVAKAQEHCKEQDSAWRLEILLALLQSQVDSSLKEEATKTCHTALQLARKKVPDRLLDVLKLQMLYGLGEGKTTEKEMKSIPEWSVLCKLYKLKHAISQGSVKHSELEPELRKLLEATVTVKHSKKTPGSSKQSSPSPISPESKAALLLDIAQMCLDQGLVELCGDCMAALPGEMVWPRLNLLRHTVASQLDILKSAHLSPYSRAAVEIREKTITQLEGCVIAAQRLGDQELVQHVGVILWGACLPLLQPNLRIRLLPTLTTLASALEQVDSLQYDLRCSVHMELAKVCADQSQLQTALGHINKARELDGKCEWSEQLQWLEERLQLRSQLYSTPPSPLQQATQILEQVMSSSECGTKPEMRAVLVKVGVLMAPNNFKIALKGQQTTTPAHPEAGEEVVIAEESESGMREEEDGNIETEDDVRNDEKLVRQDPPAVGSTLSVSSDSEYSGITRLKERREEEAEARKGGEKWYEVVKEQVQAHKEDIATEDAADRCRLWADLAKLGRKHEIWGVAFVAAKFCLIYDDNRWTVEPTKVGSQSSKTGSKPKLQKMSSMNVNRSRSDVSTRTSSSGLVSTSTARPAVEREEGRRRGQERLNRVLLRTLAETHCIHAECAVYQLKEGGHELGHGITSVPRSQQAVETTVTNSIEVVWPGQLSSDAYTSFLRAGELGCNLREAWLVTNVATYLCNYSHHLLQAGSLSPLVFVFRPLLASVVAVVEHGADAHSIGDDLLCRLSTVLAGGLVQTWMPSPPDPSTVDLPTTAGGRKSAAKGRLTTGKKKSGGGGGGETQLQVSPDAGPELQEALQVCERGLKGAGELTLDTRAALLAVWVQCKQLLQQPISSKTLGIEKEVGDSEAVHCRAIVAVEMLSVMGNGIWDFPDCPTLNNAFELMCVGEWSDTLLELELLTRIARLALVQGNYHLVSECSTHALQSVQMSRKMAGEKRERERRDVQRERELLSCMCSLQGQALVAGGEGSVVSARKAMEAFLQSAKYGRDAGSYSHSLEACQHYWNTCRDLTSSPLDRNVLQQPLSELLAILTSFLPRRTHTSVQGEVKADDLQLHVAMYNIVFQVYTDKGEWEEGLKAIEGALWVTPKTIHRHLAQHKLVFRSKMRRDVDGDMIRFQDDPEEERAKLWFTVACNSASPHQQLKAFQNAIDTLTSQIYTLQKAEYILTFSEWLYTHQYPVQDALSHLQWALTLLLQSGTAVERKEEEEGGMGEEGRRQDRGHIDGEVDKPATSVSVMEKAVQVYVIMAQLHGRGSQGHRESCLAALAYCCLICKNTLESHRQSVSGKSDIPTPTSVQEWADFTLTEELRDYIKSSDSETSLNKDSIVNPALTSHYLGGLSDELCACGLHALALPVETLRLMAAECLLQSVSASQLVHLRLMSMCTAIGAQTSAEKHRKQAGLVYLNAEDLAQSHTEMQEHRMKQDMVVREESRRKGSELKARPHAPFSTPLPASPPVCDKAVLRDIWVQEAALLVQQGQYQIARELLREAKTSAKVFRDTHTMARALLAQASLAMAEKRVDECVRCICEAQGYPMSLDTWEECMLLLLSVASCSSAHWESCVTVVSDAVNSLDSVLNRNCNEKMRVETTQTMLCARLVALRAGGLLDRNDVKETDDLQQLCQELSTHTESLLRAGRGEAAAQVMLDHARLMVRCSTNSATDMSHRASLIEAVELLQGAVSTLQIVLEDTQSLCLLSDGLHLPLEGVMIKAQLELAETLLLVYEEHVLEERQRKSQHQQKSCIEQMIDDYVQESPQQSLVDEQWNTMANTAAEQALAVLTYIYTCKSVQSQTQLKARCVYGIGQALLLVSEYTSPDSPCQWWEGHNTAETVGEKGSGTDIKINRHSTLSLVMRKEEASKAEIAETESIQYLSKACQSLGQALSLALKCGDKVTAEKAALKMVECCGTCDAETTALHLALYQSCVASRHLFQLICQVQSDPSESKLAALLQQYSELSYTSTSLPLLEATSAELDTYMCWKRLQVSTEHLDLLRSFPSHFRFLVLQHSEDKSKLYSAYLIPPQPPAPAPKKGQPPPITVSVQPIVSLVSVSTRDRECLLQLVDSSKKLQAQQMLKSQNAKSPLDSGLRFEDITSAMNDYLSPALDPISAALQEERSDSGLAVILLADFDLLQLPLEALNLLQSDCVMSVARDFSLQMLYHRISKYVVGDEERSKKDKIPSQLQANTNNFKYILDPRCELKNSKLGEEEQPQAKILSEIQAFPKITSKWSGHSTNGLQDAMSSSQWHLILKQCSGFLFFGTERLLAHLSPQQLVSLSMQDCNIAVVMDHMQTLRSSLTQSKLDTQKSTEELQTEQCLQAAALLTLVGVDSLITRQWYSTVHTCTNTMCSFIKQLLSEGVSIAEMRWREIKEQEEIEQQQQQEISAEDGATVDELSVSQNIANPQKDLLSTYNSTVYGLPHVAFTLST